MRTTNPLGNVLDHLEHRGPAAAQQNGRQSCCPVLCPRLEGRFHCFLSKHKMGTDVSVSGDYHPSATYLQALNAGHDGILPLDGPGWHASCVPEIAATHGIQRMPDILDCPQSSVNAHLPPNTGGRVA